MKIRLLSLLLFAGAACAAPIPPGDNAAPVISDLSVKPASGPVDTHYTITLHVTSVKGPKDIEDTLYQTREQMEDIPLPLNDLGVNGDAEAGDGIYTAIGVVPHSAAAGVHTFTVFVKDRAGRHSNVLLYQFTVLKRDSMLQTSRGSVDPPVSESTTWPAGSGER